MQFPGLKKAPNQFPFMQVVAPKEQDTANRYGFSFVIQNVYKARQIVPAALPKPVYIDNACTLLLESGIDDPIDHPSNWSTCIEFDPTAFLANIDFAPQPMKATFRPPAILKPLSIFPNTPSPQPSCLNASPATAFKSLASSVASSPQINIDKVICDIDRFSERDFDADSEEFPQTEEDALDPWSHPRSASPTFLNDKVKKRLGASKRSGQSDQPLKRSRKTKKNTVIEIL